MKSAARTSGDFWLLWASSAAGPKRTTRSAYRTVQGLLNGIGKRTSLSDTIAPEVPLHWVITAPQIKEFVFLTQRGDLCTGIAIVDGHDICDTEDTDCVCAKG